MYARTTRHPARRIRTAQRAAAPATIHSALRTLRCHARSASRAGARIPPARRQASAIEGASMKATTEDERPGRLSVSITEMTMAEFEIVMGIRMRSVLYNVFRESQQATHLDATASLPTLFATAYLKMLDDGAFDGHDKISADRRAALELLAQMSREEP